MQHKEKLTAVVALEKYDPNSLICEFLYEYGYEVIAVTDYFYDFVQHIIEDQPDLALFDATLYNSNTEKYYNRIKENNYKTNIYAISNEYHEFNNDIECIRVSALDFSCIDKNVRMRKGILPDKSKNKLHSRLIEILFEKNISPKLNGYKYICDATELVLHDPMLINNLTISLYPKIALINNTSAEAVERAIRLAVDKADIKVHLSAGEFIGYIVQILQSEFNT